MQVRDRPLHQHQEGDQPGRDSAEAQACPKLYRILMGPQVRPRLLGRLESVRLDPHYICLPSLKRGRHAVVFNVIPGDHKDSTGGGVLRQEQTDDTA